MTRLAWHFLHSGGQLRTGEVAPPDGEWLVHTGLVIPCLSGLHASAWLLDALTYAPASGSMVLCRVELGGEIVEHAENRGSAPDKLVASKRRILWRLDDVTTDKVLRSFARWCAQQVQHLWDAPPVVTEWLETGDERMLASARAAVRNTYWPAVDTSRGVASMAAWHATQNDTWGAAWDSARAAATAVAKSTDGEKGEHDNAARAVAQGVVRSVQTLELERLANEAHRGAQG